MPLPSIHPGKLLPCLLWVALSAAPGQAAQTGGIPGGVGPERPAEYMVYQYAETALVLKLDAPALEFSVRTTGPDATPVKSSSLPGRRMGPLFQFIDSVERPRQLMIDVTPARPVDRAAIRLEVQQYGAADPNAGILTRAFHLMSAGTETVHSSDTSTWASKSGALRGAADIFGSLGMEEMRLWCNYFAALIVLNQLDDPLTASELATEIRSAATRAGLRQVELAAAVLIADARFALAMGLRGEADDGRVESARAALADAAEQAQAQGVAVESGRAIYREGLLLEQDGATDLAIERYELALERVLAGGDSELANEIRATSAALHESLGLTSGALALIDNITDELSATNPADVDAELAAGLFEKGRLLNAAYRYSEAVPELARALDLRRAGGGDWAEIALELGWSHYALGQRDTAASLLEAGLRRGSAAGQRGLLVRSLGALATIRRLQGRYVDAGRIREQQGAELGEGAGRAGYLFESAMDAYMRDGPGAAGAQSLLTRAAAQAELEGDSAVLHRSRLWLCLLRSEQAGPAACDLANAAAAQSQLAATAIPAAAADGALIQARILARAGRGREARDLLQALVRDLYWYRSVLPGVLGPWFPQQRDAVFRDYLDLARPMSSADGRTLLLAGEQLRLLEAADFPLAGRNMPGEADDDEVRSLLARREAAAEREAAELASRLQSDLDRLRKQVRPVVPMLEGPALDRLLARLQPDEAVLGFHFDGRRSLALIASSRNVQAVPLPGGSTALDRLVELRSLLGGPGNPDVSPLLTSLGQDLFGPLREALPEVLFLLSTGPIRGVPVDALRLDGAYLAERHQVVGLQRLESLAVGRPRMPDDWPDRVFAAGNPQDPGDPFSLELIASPELTAVTDRFVGPGLQVVQGVALQQREFESERLRQAALVHLALPGTIDLEAPAQSQLRLSAGPNDVAGTWLAPAQVRNLDLDGQFVVLTATACRGGGEPAWDSRIAFADDFIEAGAQAVLLSLWVQAEPDRLAFVSGLYDALTSTPDIAAAVTAAKRAAIVAEGGINLGGWAGFQLFIR